MRHGGGVDRLTGPELSSFVPEMRGWPADIGVIAILGGAGLFDDEGRLCLTGVRDVIAARLHQAPRLRQVVHRPGPGLGRPLWVDARRFDIADHVHICAPRRIKRTCCGHARSCASAGWTSPARCGNCGCCPAFPAAGSACSSRRTMRSPTGPPR